MSHVSELLRNSRQKLRVTQHSLHQYRMSSHPDAKGLRSLSGGKIEIDEATAENESNLQDQYASKLVALRKNNVDLTHPFLFDSIMSCSIIG